MMVHKNNRGFSLMQLIVVMLVIIVLSAAAFIWIDPLTRLGNTKDAQRTKDIAILSTAIADYVSDHGGALPILGNITTNKRVLCTSQSGSNLTCDGTSKLCLKIDDDDFYNYITSLPYDPDKSSTADTGYYLQKNSNGALVVGTCDTYGSDAINKTLAIKPGCAEYGSYGGGHCWYAEGAANVSCDTICENYFGLDCVEGASYGPDVDSNGDPFCILNQDTFNTICGLGCTANATGTPPGITSACFMQAAVVVCAQSSGSGQIPICACE